MSLRSPTEDENGGIPLGTVFPQFVIPAHAGIQIYLRLQLAWIPAFAGMTEAVA